MKFVGLFVAALSAWGQSAFTRPFLGEMIDQHRMLRPVYGVGGNFSAGQPQAERVFASACSASGCIAKTQFSLVSGNVVTPAPPGGAVIAADSTGATVYFAQTKTFARWQNGSLSKLDLTVQGAVLSMASRVAGLAIAVERDGIIWIVGTDGSILDSLPDQTTAVLLLPALSAYSIPEAIVLRKLDGSELRFPAPGIESLTALADGYVEAAAGGVLYALRTVSGHEQLFQLPTGASK